MQERNMLPRAPRGGRPGCLWMARELGEPCVCFACVYLGVLSLTLLPGSLVALVAPAGLIVSPLVALPLAIRVFDRGAYARWRASARAPLLVRLLRAASDGTDWRRWWR